MNILVVEDDQTIATGLEYSLQQEGYSTIICHDFASAKEVISQQYDEISLCLFDLSLPDGSGYDLCELVKKRGDIPVIFLTVMDDGVNVVMGLDNEGVDDYIKSVQLIDEVTEYTHITSTDHFSTQLVENISTHPLQIH